MGFLGFLLQGLPLIGRAFDSFDSYTKSKMNTDLEKYKVKGTVDVEAMKQDTAIIEARTNLIAQMKDDPAAKWGRRLIIYPWGIWFTLITYRSILQESSWAEYSWVIKAYPANLEYIGYAIIAYLLGTAWKK